MWIRIPRKKPSILGHLRKMHIKCSIWYHVRQSSFTCYFWAFHSIPVLQISLNLTVFHVQGSHWALVLGFSAMVTIRQKNLVLLVLIAWLFVGWLWKWFLDHWCSLKKWLIPNVRIWWALGKNIHQFHTDPENHCSKTWKNQQKILNLF